MTTHNMVEALDGGQYVYSWSCFHWLVLDVTVLHGDYTKEPIIAMNSQWLI